MGATFTSEPPTVATTSQRSPRFACQSRSTYGATKLRTKRNDDEFYFDSISASAASTTTTTTALTNTASVSTISATTEIVSRAK